MNEASLKIARTAKGLAGELSAARAQGRKIALVPTMGALHEGHLALVKQAVRRADIVVASIFVNPTQFAPHEDFGSYPRDEARDLTALQGAGCHIAYVPQAAEIYPPREETRVVPGPLAEPLDGRSRPHFFTGVCTVVAKLFGQTRPDLAFFGEKDFQQLLVVRRMAQDLCLGVEIVGVPIVREADGLAMSSRNRYLSAEERRIAGRLNAILFKAGSRIAGGVPAGSALHQGREELEAAGLCPVDYLEARSARDLSPMPTRSLRREEIAEARLFAAVTLGRTRLIDNVAIGSV